MLTTARCESTRSIPRSMNPDPVRRHAHLFARQTFSADLEHTNKKGLTPLQLAVRAGHLGVTEELLTRGARPNVKSKAGLCLRCLAGSMGHGYLVVSTAHIELTDVHRARWFTFASSADGSLSSLWYGCRSPRALALLKRVWID